MFWDRDGDGQIFPWGVFFDFQEPGFSIPVSILIILIVNINVSYPTRMAYSWLPDPSFRVNVPNIHKAKHGSDCGTYDPEDLFRRRLRTFCKHDHNNDGALTVRELFNLMHGHRCAADPFGVGNFQCNGSRSQILTRHSGAQLFSSGGRLGF
jgi:hypothetical protein